MEYIPSLYKSSQFWDEIPPLALYQVGVMVPVIGGPKLQVNLHLDEKVTWKKLETMHILYSLIQSRHQIKGLSLLMEEIINNHLGYYLKTL